MEPFLSVVIPTKDRAATLARTLETLAEQDAPEGGAEVVVVDDGSSDGTAAVLQGWQSRSELPVRGVGGPGRGAASARNAGVAAAAGSVVLFLGDDTRPAERPLLARHAELHRRRPEAEYAVLGRVTWSDDQDVTPFMYWLEHGGPQFAYDTLSAGPVEASSYFYTAHVSVKRQLLDEAGGFDERFPGAAVEDIELGVRLEQRGIELDYRPELLVLHDHLTTLAGSLARTEGIGRAAVLYNELQPSRPHVALAPPAGFLWRLLRCADPAVAAGKRGLLPENAVRPAWRLLHLAAYARGYREAAARASGPQARRASSSRRPASPSS